MAALEGPASFYEHRFAAWRIAHNRTYPDGAEIAKRLRIFETNAKRIEAHNAQPGITWRMAMNQFGDLTPDEFAARFHLGSQRFFPNPSTTAPVLATTGPPPASIDWRTSGAVTPVKNQGQCGSCWAFSTTGSTEGAHFLASGKLTSLSEQQLVDCSKSYGNNGCGGGLMDKAFKYIIATGGLDTEASYPYTAKTGTTCLAKNGIEVKDLITGYTDVPPSNETALLLAASQQPVSVAIQANQMSFQFYSSGVLSAECGTQLDHGVLVVGYGTDAHNHEPYWLVKNSWGETWGEAGYVRLGRSDKKITYNAGAGQCGIALRASFPQAAAA